MVALGRLCCGDDSLSPVVASEVCTPGAVLQASMGPEQPIAVWEGVCWVLFFHYPGGFTE